MKKRGLSQEGLKLIAAVAMLLDHIGATIVDDLFYAAASAGGDAGTILQFQESLRMIGRLAFPIYCFLLAEGAAHTRSPKRYALRLLAGAILAEIPFDLLFYGRITWDHQNVMLTLLLGFLMLEVMKRCNAPGWKLAAVLPFAVAAQLLHTDYGADGILVVALFTLTRELPCRAIWQFLGLWCIFSPNHLMALNWLGRFAVTIQELASFAIVPIALYDGRKTTKNKVVQWVFYLFYPAHLLVLYLVGKL